MNPKGKEVLVERRRNPDGSVTNIYKKSSTKKGLGTIPRPTTTTKTTTKGNKVGYKKTVKPITRKPSYKPGKPTMAIRSETAQPMKKMGTRTSPIPPVTSTRKTPRPGIPNKPSVAMYSKRSKTQSPDWGVKNKRRGITTSPVKAAIAFIDPTRKVEKAKGGTQRWHRGAKQRIPTTRPLPEKKAIKRDGSLRKGVVKTQLGTETIGSYKGSSKRTKAGQAKETKVKKKYQRH